MSDTRRLVTGLAKAGYVDDFLEGPLTGITGGLLEAEAIGSIRLKAIPCV